MTYTLDIATEADALELLPRLREADHKEVISLGTDPLAGLLAGVRQGREAWTARVDGEIICMTGVVPLTAIGPTGIPWLLGSDLVGANAKHFLRESRRLVARWQEMFPVLRNIVDDRYTAAIRWLRWLDFRISDPVLVGPNRMPFRIAEKERTDG